MELRWLAAFLLFVAPGELILFSAIHVCRVSSYMVCVYVALSVLGQANASERRRGSECRHARHARQENTGMPSQAKAGAMTVVTHTHSSEQQSVEQIPATQI